jgi:protein-S-isoprenylcysteine O-methyltransferase Ste14
MKNTPKMTRWGCGPRFAIVTLIYSVVIYFIHDNLTPNLIFDIPNIIGWMLIVIGSILFIYPAVTIDYYFNNSKLRTTGLYSYVRHPIYASWIYIIIPAIVILWGSILAISIPFVAYLIFKKLIHIEEEYLAQKFGIEYWNYKLKVNATFPKIKIFKL